VYLVFIFYCKFTFALIIAEDCKNENLYDIIRKMAAADEKKAVIYAIPCTIRPFSRADTDKYTVYLIYVPELEILIDKEMKIEIVKNKHYIHLTKLLPSGAYNICTGPIFEGCEKLGEDVYRNAQNITISLKLFKFIEKLAEHEKQLIALKTGREFFNEVCDISDIYRDYKLYHKN
jgi:hypothetical protein